jgi:hypothetical protein
VDVSFEGRRVIDKFDAQFVKFAEDSAERLEHRALARRRAAGGPGLDLKLRLTSGGLSLLV